MSWNQGGHSSWTSSVVTWGETGSAAAAASAPDHQDDCSGSYFVSWGDPAYPIVEISKTPTGVTIKDPRGNYPQEEGFLSGDRIEFWGWRGVLKAEGAELHIEWDRWTRWTRVQGTAPAAQRVPPSLDGFYRDWTGDKVVHLVFAGTSVTARDTTGNFPTECGTVHGHRICFGNIRGTIDATTKEILFDHGGKWLRLQDDPTIGCYAELERERRKTEDERQRAEMLQESLRKLREDYMRFVDRMEKRIEECERTKVENGRLERLVRQETRRADGLAARLAATGGSRSRQ